MFKLSLTTLAGAVVLFASPTFAQSATSPVISASELAKMQAYIDNDVDPAWVTTSISVSSYENIDCVDIRHQGKKNAPAISISSPPAWPPSK